jgi:hypothetical protein
LKTIGTILQRSYDCDELFFELVQMLVDYSCHASQVHRALAISELLEVPTAQFGVILKNLSIWSIRELETTPKLVQSICQILGKSTSEFIEMTWPFTLPGLVQSKETSMVTTVITKGKHLEKVEVVKRLVHYSGDIMAYLLVYGESSDLDFFLGLLEPVKSTEDITYGFVFRTNQLQLLRNIVVECGDLDSSVQAKVV